MFFLLFFLILAATASYFFPDWSTVTTLLAAFACVAMLRIALGLFARSPAKKDE